jgi:hypothetical protein
VKRNDYRIKDSNYLIIKQVENYKADITDRLTEAYRQTPAGELRRMRG